MQIRPLQATDYPALYALWLSCKGMGLNNLDDSPLGIARFLERNPNTCFAAEEGEALVGTILAGNDGRRGYIYHLAVSPSHRKQGLGRALVEQALQALKHEGIHKVALVVFAHNESANVFWEKLGFTSRSDLVYRNKALVEMERMDT